MLEPAARKRHGRRKALKAHHFFPARTLGRLQERDRHIWPARPSSSRPGLKTRRNSPLATGGQPVCETKKNSPLGTSEILPRWCVITPRSDTQTQDPETRSAHVKSNLVCSHSLTNDLRYCFAKVSGFPLSSLPRAPNRLGGV